MYWMGLISITSEAGATLVVRKIVRKVTADLFRDYPAWYRQGGMLPVFWWFCSCENENRRRTNFSLMLIALRKKIIFVLGSVVVANASGLRSSGGARAHEIHALQRKARRCLH